MIPSMRTFLRGAAALWIAGFLAGCSHFPLIDPRGPIGNAERLIIFVALGLMLIVVIPVLIMLVVFPRKYRAGNSKATYMPDWSSSGKIELVIWLVPALIVAAMAIMIWITTHQLDPYKPIEAGAEPVQIEVVSLAWKWLFIYPDQQIATVNELVFPAKTPLSFRLTSNSVMTSFFIPRLGSQIYAMGGMQTRLHLLADEPGTYTGQNQQFSGEGYARMNFKAVATASREQFDDWVRQVRQSAQILDQVRYLDLAEPGTDYPVNRFSMVQSGLFDHVLNSFNHGAGSHPGMHHGSQASGTVPSQSLTNAVEEN